MEDGSDKEVSDMEGIGTRWLTEHRDEILPAVQSFEVSQQHGNGLHVITSLQGELDVAQKVDDASWLILQAAGEGIYGIDRHGTTVFANPATEAITGWKTAELIGRSQHATIHHSHADGSPYPRDMCPIYMALRDGLVHRSDSEVFWRKDGTSFPVAYTSTPIMQHGQPDGAVVIFQDISGRKRKEEWEKNKNSVFFAITSHVELGAILTLIANAFTGLHLSQSIALFTYSGTSLHLVAQGRLPDRFQQSMATNPASWAASACVSATEQGTEIHATRNMEQESSFQYHEFRYSHFTSCLAVPLLSGLGKVLGTIAIFATDRDFVDRHVRESINSVCGLARLAIEHQQLHAELVRQSRHDPLTSLPNRLLLEDRLEQAIMQARRHGTQVGICYVDLDGFKLINDTLGHSAGDVFLQGVARVLTKTVRQIDTVARQGGDEFILVFPDMHGENEAEEICERILLNLERPITIGKHALTPAASIGISVYPADGETVSVLLRNADTALYAVKRSGKGKVQRYDGMLGNKVQRKLDLQTALRSALKQKQFSLVYQPLYDTSSQLKGFEALLRWFHPELGQINPEQFVPIAEETGLIVSIGGWVLDEACRQAAEWNAASLTPLRIFVNVSGVQLSQPDFPEVIARALAWSDLVPALLEIEITETCIVKDPASASAHLTRLRSHGIGISIDDFGMGHSSFSYLHQLPVDTIKIDRSFVARLDGSAKGSAIVRTILDLAEQFGLKTVAEGVETELQFNELCAMQCGLFQGYLLARPLPADAASLLVSGNKRSSSENREKLGKRPDILRQDLVL